MNRACAALAVLALGCDGGKPRDSSTGSGVAGPVAGSGDAAGSGTSAGLVPDAPAGSGDRPIIIVTKSEITINGKLVGEVREPSRLLDGRIPDATSQLITGVLADWTSTRATLQLWTRASASAPWVASGPPWDAAIGKNGAAWGIGLHGADFTPEKHEGDGKSPAGVFALRGSYGYADAPPSGTKLPYTKSDKLECVDDPASKHYTQILDGTSTPRDWTSSERMRQYGHFYAWVIDIAHNPRAAPKSGSCIFFHVWSGADSPTDGCTAMAEPTLVALLKQLDPAAAPIYVLLPRAEYDALAPVWGLPPA